MRSPRLASLRTLLAPAARLALVAVAAFAAIASAGSQDSKPAANNTTSAPPPQSMDPQMAMGLWKSSFGAVKVESNARGAAGDVHGVWVYDRQGVEVIGYFGGNLRGNVLEFSWTEPSTDGSQLTGAGYVVFDPYGQRFTGKWWTQSRDRQGEWTGWRAEPAAPSYDDSGDGDDGYVPPPT